MARTFRCRHSANSRHHLVNKNGWIRVIEIGKGEALNSNQIVWDAGYRWINKESTKIRRHLNSRYRAQTKNLLRNGRFEDVSKSPKTCGWNTW